MKIFLFITAAALLGLWTAPSNAASLLDEYASQAQQENPNFEGFSAERGNQFFLKNHASGKAETPACTTCHTQDPDQAGQTRAGKTIAPLASSRSPERYTDPAKTEKWFRRNCNSVLGRECSATEKGDFITFMQTQ